MLNDKRLKSRLPILWTNGYLDQRAVVSASFTTGLGAHQADYTAKNWLLLVESVISHEPVDGKRHAALANLFAGSTANLVYVTALPNRAIMSMMLDKLTAFFERFFGLI